MTLVVRCRVYSRCRGRLRAPKVQKISTQLTSADRKGCPSCSGNPRILAASSTTGQGEGPVRPQLAASVPAGRRGEKINQVWCATGAVSERGQNTAASTPRSTGSSRASPWESALASSSESPTPLLAPHYIPARTTMSPVRAPRMRGTEARPTAAKESLSPGGSLASPTALGLASSNRNTIQGLAVKFGKHVEK